MKIDKRKLDELCKMGDAELWCEVRRIAAAHGFNLPEATPPHGELEKMRNAVSGGAKISLADAAKIINSYRGCKK